MNNVPPSVLASTPAVSKPAVSKLGSDQIATTTSLLDWESLADVAATHSLGNYYNRDEGYCHPPLAKLGQRTGLSRSTIIRNLKRMERYWNKKSGHEGVATRYYPKPEVLAAIPSLWSGEGVSAVPTHINPDTGCQPELHQTRRRVELPQINVADFAGSWYLPGTKDYLPQFLDPSLSPAQALARTGVTHSRSTAYVLGECAYSSERARGASIRLGHMLNTGTGYASPAASYFRITFKLSPRQLEQLNRELIASGLWRIYTDHFTRQSIYILSPLALAQLAVYNHSLQALDENGKQSRFRSTVVNHQPHIGSIVATLAEELGVNDLIGLEGMTAENPLTPGPGVIYAREQVSPATKRKGLAMRIDPKSGMPMLLGGSSNSPLGYVEEL